MDKEYISWWNERGLGNRPVGPGEGQNREREGVIASVVIAILTSLVVLRVKERLGQMRRRMARAWWR